MLKDGWFYTGDIGEIDADGFLTITDRKKDIIVTSGGKKIAPQPLENTLKAEPLVAEAVIIGEQRRFPAVLIVPNFAALDAKAEALGLRASLASNCCQHPTVQALYQEALNRLNAKLAQFERIKRFALLPSEFTMERGELTPTMKVRRKVVEDRWKSLIDGLYESRGTAGPSRAAAPRTPMRPAAHAQKTRASAIGHHLSCTLPMMYLFGTRPQWRLSELLFRWSPITK